MEEINNILYKKYVIISNFELENYNRNITLIKVENGNIIDSLSLKDSKTLSNQDKLRAREFIGDYLVIARDTKLVLEIDETINTIYPNFDIAWAEIRFEDKVQKIRAEIENRWEEYALKNSSISEFNYIYRGCYFTYEDVELYNYICQNATLGC